MSIIISTSVQAYNLNQVIENLIHIESNGNISAIGDNGNAVGALQIWPIMVKEVNRIIGSDLFKNEDRLNLSESKAICKIFLAFQRQRYAKRFGKYPDELTLACSWNSGSIFNKKPASYEKKYKKIMKQKEK